MSLLIAIKGKDEDVADQNVNKELEPRQKSQGAERGSWRTALKAAWQPIFRLNRANLTAFQALRGTLGVAFPLIIGIVVLKQVDGGVIVASGALMLGSVGLTYTYRARTQAMLLTSFFVTVSALVGGIAGGMGWPTIPLIGLWGLVAGLFASLSQTALIVGLQSCVAFIVYSHLRLDPSHALLIAGLIGLGALFQTLLAVIPSPWKNTMPERSALTALYQELASYAHHPSTSQGALQVSDALFQGYTVLLAGDTRSARGQIFARLLAEAERARLTLSLLNRERVRLLAHEPEPTCTSVRVSLTEIMRASGDELHAIAQALQPRSPFTSPDSVSLAGSSEEVKRAIIKLRHFIHASGKQGEMQPLLQHCTALLSELRIARKLATSWRDTRHPWPVALRLPYPHAPGLYLENLWSNLRANLSPRSAAFHHAIRLSVALILAMTLFYIFQLPNERGYWIPMTTVVVLRSDFITTVTRGSARFLGTLLGAVLTTLLVILLAPSPQLMIVIYVLAVYLMLATVLANYVIFSIMVTTAVVFLLAFVKAPTLTTAAERALDTTIGGGLALLVYLLWPTWERSQLPEFMAQRFEKLGQYGGSVMQAYADPARAEKSVLGKYHLDSRLARSNALGSLQRARQEPRTTRADLDLADDLLSAADMLARSVITLEAYLFDHPHHDTLPEMAACSQTIEQALHQLAAATRTRRSLTNLLDVGTTLYTLHTAARARKDAHLETQAQWQLVGEECKRIVKYVGVMQQLLSTRHDVHTLT